MAINIISIGSGNGEGLISFGPLHAVAGEENPLTRFRGGKFDLQDYSFFSGGDATTYHLRLRGRKRGLRVISFIGPRGPHFLPGGSAVSIAIGLAGLGARTNIAIPLAGENDFCYKLISAKAEELGINILPPFGDQREPVSFVIYGLPSGDERSIVFPFKPDYEIDKDRAELTLKAIREREGTTHVVATGIRRVKELQFIGQIFEKVRQQDQSVVTYFMPNSVLLPRKNTFIRSQLRVVLNNTSIWQMNAQEASIYLGQRIPFPERVRELARVGDIGYRDDDPRVTIVTCGAKGAWAMIAGEHYEVAPYIATNVIDTAGAGDAFAAGFIFARDIPGCTPREALQLAAFVAGAKIGVAGGCLGIPERDQIDRYLAQLRAKLNAGAASESTASAR